jgi:hypothetical protein
MGLYLKLDAFPEVQEVLNHLKAAGLRTTILSNGSPKMLDAAVKAAKLDKLLDEVLSVEEVGGTSHTRRTINLPSIGSAFRQRLLRSSRRTLGTRTPHQRSVCEWSGAIVIGSAGRICQAPLTVRSGL